jgi:hypothetical protein
MKHPSHYLKRLADKLRKLEERIEEKLKDRKILPAEGVSEEGQ